MTYSPMAFASSLRVGSIDFVSPDEIRVLLDIEAPDSLALNSGSPRPFPRINGYLLVPSDDGYLVGQVEWITIERSQYPKRKGMQDFGLVDLPYPLRKLRLNPLGKLCAEGEDSGGNPCYRLRRGVESFPSVGDPTLLPTRQQLRAIIESGDKRRVKIGTSPLADGAEVRIDPDKLFGRHLAVLGNTGSGKSCSVAGLIRWSLDSAKASLHGNPQPNARFIVLDPNGEYQRAFADLPNVRIFAVDPPPESPDVKPLHVPLWFWNSAEWCAFTQAGAGAQKPLLRRALREVRNGGAVVESEEFKLRSRISSILITLRSKTRSGDSYEGWKIGDKLTCYKTDLDRYVQDFPSFAVPLQSLATQLGDIISRHGRPRPKRDDPELFSFQNFPVTVLDDWEQSLAEFCDSLGGILVPGGPSEDAPVPFNAEAFADHFFQMVQAESQPQYFDYLLLRIRTLLSETRLKPILNTDANVSLESWLTDTIGADGAANGTVTVIDLSLVPSEVVHILTTVIARMTFEALQRYRRSHPQHKVLPTVLVMEEAHTFIKRYKEDAENFDAAATCCQLFERIAREGRKFGLGLVLSSQRPSELSPTVLSQCNTFLLHRISNDRDQELVQKLVPDNLRGILRDLPSLPSQNAILLGWAAELPVLVRMNDLPDEHQPQSNDPDFWSVWTGEPPEPARGEARVERPINWAEIAAAWQGTR